MKLTDHISMVGGGQYSAGLSSDYDGGVFLVRVAGQRWLIDAGSGYESRALHTAVRNELAGEPLDGIAITHSHSDHAGGAKSLSTEFGCEVYASGETSRRMASRDVEAVAADSAIRAGIYPADYRFGWLENVKALHSTGPTELANDHGESFIALPTPGHSDDHMCYVLEVSGSKFAFTGDLIFARGRVSLLGTDDCNIGALVESVSLLSSVNPDAILPGHGTVVMNGARWHIDRALKAFDHGQVPANFA